MWDETKFECEGGIYGEPIDEPILIQVHLMDLAKTIKTGAMLFEDIWENFKEFLWRNFNVIAWLHKDMSGINL